MKLGYELECGIKVGINQHGNRDYMTGFLECCNSKGFLIAGDGSVSVFRGLPTELKSRVYDLNNQEDINIILEDFKKISEFISEVNKSCGLHFHVSFENIADYYTLCSFAFAEQFINEYSKVFTKEKEKSRLENHYCNRYTDYNEFKKFVKGQLRATIKCGERYKAINYNAFNLYRTIEFRIFPSCDNLKEFESYLRFLVVNVNTFIKDNSSIKKNEVIKKRRSFKDKDEDSEVIINVDNVDNNVLTLDNYINRMREERLRRLQEQNNDCIDNNSDNDNED